MKDNRWTLLFLAWTVALVASLGSLFFSEVMRYAPCTLCWYQRLCMFPLVLILGRALVFSDFHVTSDSLPLSVLGVLIALYHGLLYYGVLPESASPCTQGASCLTKYFELGGFITIPFLSLVSFILITGLLTLLSRKLHDQ